MSLRLTKTRLALLEAVAEGLVWEYYPFSGKPAYTQHVVDKRHLSAAIAEAARAGWTALDPDAPPPRWGDSRRPRRWVLTKEGRDVMEAAA